MTQGGGVEWSGEYSNWATLGLVTFPHWGCVWDQLGGHKYGDNTRLPLIDGSSKTVAEV